MLDNYPGDPRDLDAYERWLIEEVRKAREASNFEQQQLENTYKQIEQIYGIDYLNVLQGKIPERPVQLVEKRLIYLIDDGRLHAMEEYIRKRDDSLVLLRITVNAIFYKD